MYLSTLELDPQCPSACRDLRWPYEMYRTLKRCRANAGLDEEVRILFCYGEQNRVLVQSPAPLHFWNGIPLGYATSITTQKMEPPKAGEILEFELTANPVIKKSRSNYRIAIRHTNEQLAWLARQGAANGFGIAKSKVVAEGWIGQDTKDKAELPVFWVRFRGLLIVTDAERFTHGVAKGFGSGKMHGLGLLQYRAWWS